ncbi:MAG TPA: S41 family peptidase [Acidobacteriaceae bacterium]|nr:S41 family peptidase [Acidobacteriaceae bacterium]
MAAKKAPAAPQNSPTALTPDAAAFLNSVIDVMQQHELRGQSIDWAQLRKDAFEHAAGAFNPIDTYPAIYWAMVQLNDPGTRLRLPAGLYPDQIALLQQAEKDARSTAPPSARPDQPPTPFVARHLPEGRIVSYQGKNFGYVVLPTCDAKDNDGMMLYAADVRHILSDLSAQNPRGWIVDLRGNTGGNMWPMLTGIGPVLGEGVVGSFVTADGNIPWFYQNGKSGTRNNAGLETVSLSLPDNPGNVPAASAVAVLIDSSTANSAEAIAIAFHGRPQTRFFGQQTAGKSTAVQPFQLSDGAEIYMTTALDADRSGKAYPDGFTPDDVLPAIGTLPSASDDAALNAAGNWLSASVSPLAAPAPLPPAVKSRRHSAPVATAAAAPPASAPAAAVASTSSAATADASAAKPKVTRKRVIIHQGS